MNIRTADARTIALSEHGAPGGTPVFHCHGLPGSRLDGALMHDAAVRAKVRLIGFDRPGIGGSTPLATRSIGDVSSDVTQVADQLGIDRFGVVGVSGGAPYAMATAADLPHRVTALALLVPLWWVDGTLDEPLPAVVGVDAEMIASGPDALVPLIDAQKAAFEATPSLVAEALLQTAAGDDREVLTRPRVLEALTASFLECTRQSGEAVAREIWLTMNPWGFAPEEIRCPTTIWVGEVDPYTPATGISSLWRRLPAATVRTVPRLGHSAFIEAAPEVMRLMAAADRDAPARR
jgi:pimeloyl-ACP methyl ester carboxylesterase